jgi:nitrous oxide reductase accessory protein NosL
MSLFSRTTVMNIVFISFLLSSASAADIMCAECGMRVDMESKYSARAMQGKTTLYFCDIGDLFVHLKKNNLKEARIEVKDYSSGAWIDARKAFYVHSEKKFNTPMGWGTAGFKDNGEASKFGVAMDFEATAKVLK